MIFFFSDHLRGCRGDTVGLQVSVLVSGPSGPGSSPGQGHCVVFLGKTLYFNSFTNAGIVMVFTLAKLNEDFTIEKPNIFRPSLKMAILQPLLTTSRPLDITSSGIILIF